MECQKCGKKSANVHIIKDVNGKHQELFYCSDCAKAYEDFGVGFSLGMDSGFPFSFQNFLPGFIGQSKNITSTPPAELSCQSCGLTFGEFQKIGRLGCGVCYTSFHRQLAPIITRIHGNVAYRGKKPKGKTEQKTERESTLETLKKNLQEAVRREEYEKAAVIRDEIKRLQGVNNQEEGEEHEHGI